MKTEISDKRIDVIDYLRGFALLGILLVNIPFFLIRVQPPLPNSFDESYHHFLYLFVEGRFFTIFSFLFGYGFYIFMSRAKAKNENALFLFLRRLAALFVMGCIHVTFVHDLDILMAYAMVGFFLIPFYLVNKHINLIVALIGIIYSCYQGDKVVLILPLLLLGLAAGQFRIFENISEKIWKYRIFTFIAFILSIIGLWIQYSYVPTTSVDMPMNEAMDPKKFIEWGITVGPIVSAFYVGIFILLLQYSWVQKLLSPLKNYGRMSLTNYLSQSALVLTVNYCLQLSGNVTYIHLIFLCMGIYVIQLLFSTVWLRFFRMGPLEWLWRICTYWKLVPIKK
ncbi:DUF418 domain-containing protein [Bacillus sp. FJAT-28004]|uniref:DUF418 domain-containing protein n=1 Tax=Bacillus sp. FJAT-28004 TaxID=1679165 RepID=UPI0006B614CE|nr:DUF418 domain-containing protein [Bacillus sp. FJAT-28004]